MISWLFDFLNFIYPELCAACGNGLLKGEKTICTECYYHLPMTGFHKEKDNVIEKQFWGKANVHSATALYYFHKGERVQHLIHRLKYHGDKKVGMLAGRILAEQLKNQPRFSTIDTIVPVPLHAKKLRMRGFNQSDFFGQGLAEGLQCTLCTDLLIRSKATTTQTKKSRFSRYENVNKVFELNRGIEPAHSHILLVDDVITTGSTLVACAETLNKIQGLKVSVATIAYARL